MSREVCLRHLEHIKVGDLKRPGGRRGVHGISASWWGNGLPRRRRLGGLRDRPPTLGLRTAQTPTGGCSRESFAMGESLTMRRRVSEEGLRVVKLFSWGTREVYE